MNTPLAYRADQTSRSNCQPTTGCRDGDAYLHMSGWCAWQVCWHVAKVLQLLGYSEHAMLRHMGLFMGSNQGGYWRLRATTDKEEHASSDALQPGAQQQSVGVGDAEQPQRPQSGQTATPRASSQMSRQLHITRRRHCKRWQDLQPARMSGLMTALTGDG